MRRIPGALVVLLLALPVGNACADALPPPMTSSVYEFPGAVASPGSAKSAAIALADAWLGDEPFENPALPAANRASFSPLLYHMNRQDLRGFNRSYSEQSAFLDGAGAWGGIHRHALTVFAYAHQPILRLESNAYLTGPQGGSPAPVQNTSHARELRAGLGVATGGARWRLGVAGEFTHRDDSYETADKSGSPLSGTSRSTFSGSAVGGVAGARVELGPESLNHVTVGAAVRLVPELKVDGDFDAELLSGSSAGSFSATRASGVEGGLSARWTATPQLLVVAGAGGRTGQEWKGFGVTRGPGFRWGLGVDFHDARDPWTLRAGVGQDNGSGVPEPRTGVVSLGIGWDLEGTLLDFAALRHTFSHLGGATSYDDRVIASVVLPF